MSFKLISLSNINPGVPGSRKLSGRVPLFSSHGPRGEALEGAGSLGQEAVTGDPYPTPLGAGSQSQQSRGVPRSLTTGPHCYCFCGGPWSRTQRRRAG